MFKQLSNRIFWHRLLYSVVALIVLGGLVTLMGFIKGKSSEQACTEVRIVVLGAESFIEQQDIMAMLVEKYGELEGRTLEDIPTHEMEKDLRQIPFVFSAMVTIDMDGVLAVRIVQREAVVRVINNKGLDFYIDKEGHKMPVSLKYVPRVPVVNGHITEPYNGALDSMETQLVKDIFKTAQFINADSVWSSQVVQLYVNEYQDIELVPRVGNQQIILGNADSLERKFEKLMLFYNKIVPKTGIDAYTSVNLKFAGQIVCERDERFKPEELISMPDSTLDNTPNNSINTQ
ncbi:cell division protein FtsQ/DivIB [Parapedobacter koreensis]|uniref:Cell division protein FtsQ n=1 Tax=Parapedobacter koreensis TaxID=332977 RepID=A0A1H7PDM4_9SPHI|nr:cell division protein FtsQ [Parapedobacter koreensis]SEL33187.1 cell division protein FtsQ [Parapedobacter koreensis]